MSDDATSVEGVPKAGRERLRRLRESGLFFTSDLSVNEFLLVKQAGFDPLGLVLGTAIGEPSGDGRAQELSPRLDLSRDMHPPHLLGGTQ